RLGKPQLCQRSERISPTCIRNDAQLEHRDRRELDVMVFRFGGYALGTEIPLLSHDFTERLPAIRRPTQDVFLRALSDGLLEVQPDPLERLRMGEEKPDRLLPGYCGAPPRDATRQQRGLNWMSAVLRSDFHLRETLHIQPVLVGRCGLLLNWGDDSLAH